MQLYIYEALPRMDERQTTYRGGYSILPIRQIFADAGNVWRIS